MPRLPRSQRTNVTIYHIAEKLNVSASTVSRALRGHPNIRPETIDSVKKMAQKLNYQTNTLAQSLRERRTRTLGVIIPEIHPYFYGSVLNGIEEFAFRKGYHLIVSKSSETYEREMMQVFALANQVDGILACLSQETRKQDHFKQLRQQGVPLVFFDRAPEKFPAHKILFDNEACSFLLTEHLIRAGFKRIAHLTGPKHLMVCQDRLKGFYKALDRYQIGSHPDLVLTTGFGYQEGRSGFQKLMKQEAPPDAIFAGSDQIATAVAVEARRIGLVMPRDLGLVAFGSDPLNALLEPAITGLAPKGFDMGSAAAQLCIREIESTNATSKPRTELLSCDIIIRQSSVRLTDEEQLVSSYSKYIKRDTHGDEVIYIY